MSVGFILIRNVKPRISQPRAAKTAVVLVLVVVLERAGKS